MVHGFVGTIYLEDGSKTVFVFGILTSYMMINSFPHYTKS